MASYALIKRATMESELKIKINPWK